MVATDIEARIAASRAASGAERFVGVHLPAEFDLTALVDDPDLNGVVASYERPSSEFSLVAVGEAARVELPAGASPEALRDGAQRLLAGEQSAESALLRPRLLGGFAFDGGRTPGAPWAGFAAGALVLPRLLFVRDRGVSGVVVAPGVDPGEVKALVSRVISAARARLSAPPVPQLPRVLRVLRDFDRARWLTSVSSVAASIRAGLFEKVVLAAMREFEADAPIGVGAAMARLRREYPHCHLFSMRAAGATFLGASPELLVSLRDGVVRALGLAGSARRDAEPDVDAQLGQALLESTKDRVEHETVVRALRGGLTPVTAELNVPSTPTLLQLRNIQHLSTEITGKVAAGVDVFDLVQRLHPTPAVCGWPTAAARAEIGQQEAFDRGWYAGPIGWVDANGDGEFAVGLRSALVREQHAWLFAGAGIMGDSVPESELAEIEMKFTPLVGALTGGES
ncbi:MAG: isochorismate synthase [Chloroflexi bacterium]|nr:MAG: isochorismate synthase [Chloroflexota bacterium]